MRGKLGFGISFVIGGLLCGVSGGGAQDPSAQATQAQKDAGAVVQAMGKNMKGLTQYTYQQKVQMAYEGDVKSTILNQIAFNDTTGKPEVVQLSESADSGKGRRLGHRVKDKKEGEVKDEVTALTKLAPGYLFPAKDQLEKLAQTATVSYQGSNIILTVTDFVQKGDKMTIAADAATRNRISMQASTTSGDDPVTIDATYAELKDGLNYLSHYVVSCPDEKIELTVDTLNYEPAQ